MRQARLATAVLATGVANAMPSGPVAKVTKMLYDMQKELEADSKADEAAYAKMQCWCKKTIPAKEAAIAEAQQCQKSETAKIENAKGRIAEAETSITELTEQIEKETEALKTMTEQRIKTQTAFEDHQKELTQTVAALESAVEVLRKHNTGFLQTNSGQHVLQHAQRLLKARVEKMGSHVNSIINPSQRQVLTAFLAQPTFGAYSSASGQVFGMLQSMHDEFSKDLAEAQEADAADAKAYSTGKEIKEKIIADAKAALEKAEAALATAKEDLGNAEAQLAACTETLGAEQKMLEESIADCKQNVADYEQRTADRAVEMKAVDQALTFLDSDEARELFQDTFSFAQLGSESEAAAEARERAALTQDLLAKIGEQWKDVKVTILAQKVRAGAFDKIIAAIDDIVKELKFTLKEDQAKFDGCNEFINAKTKLVKELDGQLATLAAQAETLEAGIDALKSAIAALEEDIAKATETMNQATAERKEANAAFRLEQKNNDGALKLLTKTKEVLAEAFSSGEGAYSSAAAGAALVQSSQPDRPADFKQYEVNQGGNKVLEMIQGILDDTEKAMADALRQENMEQKSYENLVSDQNTLILSYKKQISEKEGEKAQKETELAQNQKTTKATEETRTVESDLLSGKKEECAFILTNLQVRKVHMNGEIKALNDAKAYLKGME